MLTGCAALVLLAGCGGGSEDSSNSSDPTAQSAAQVLQSQIADVTDLVQLDEDNDSNHLIGRPNGYTAATVIFDSRVSCEGDAPGVDCGATIEEWPSHEDAEKRSDYIQDLQSGSSLLGSEWNTIRDNLLLRVTGNMKPSDADAYADIFESADLGEDVSDEPPAAAGTEADSGVPSPDDEPWTLVDSGFGAQYGYAWTIARVQNDDDHAGQTVTVNFNLLDDAGELLASGSQVSHFSWPGQVLPVATQVEVPKGKKPATVEATVLVEDEGTFDDQISEDWGTFPGKIYQPKYSDFYGARFEVTNPTDEPLEGSSLQVVCTNKTGEIIGGSSDYPDLIPASGRVLVDASSLYTTIKPAECTGYLAPWM
ncbi:MAG: hypothetical protein JWN91_1159 [Nocardioides sp.]|nr:hypothetical protein [Nocardioides sp.]